jgi:hypothetical protein
MAGSIKWFIYTTDQGADFAIKLDESNTEAVNAGTQDYLNAGTVVNALPRNIKPRYIRVRSGDGLTTRKLVCLTPTIFAGITSGFSIANPNGAGVLFLVGKVGEKISVPFGVDTGLTDGDDS